MRIALTPWRARLRSWTVKPVWWGCRVRSAYFLHAFRSFLPTTLVGDRDKPIQHRYEVTQTFG
jgi:hypothetical protein